MVLLSLVRLRRLQRATKFVLALLFACLISYFVFTFYKWPIKAASPIYFHILSNGTGYTRALNVHIWRGLCGLNVSFLYNSPLFPRYPDEKLTISEFQTEDKDTDFGELIFGFIHPSKTGLYRFGIASDDTSELWLSPGEDPTEKRLIARVYSATESAWTEKGDLKKYSEQISSEINLVVGGKYYIEAIVKQSAGIGFIQVYWASPPDSEFQIISSEYLSLFSYDPVVVAKKDVLHKIYRATGVSKKRDNTFDRQYLAFYSLPRLPKGHFLPPCVYKSSFVLKDKIAQYNGIRVIYESNVYPGDDTEMSTPDKVWSWRNRVADKELIHSIVQKIVASLQLSTSKDYVLKRIHKVIQKSDPVFGDRFSLDLEVGLNLNTNQSYRLSEHVYLQKGTGSLCFPEGIEWNDNATVYFILPVKDQGKWVYHFINQLSEASLLTGDTNFHVVVIDFESQDIDMKRAFNTSLLRSRHTVVNLQGKFYKTLALNEGVEVVPSPRDIVFLFDLHIDVPVDILDSVRKNTIEGRVAYFPIVGRLDCGSTADEHRGFWEMDGYGILGVYKSDWIRFGGMNAEDFKYQWGGEDWDLLDRVLNAQLEVERVRYPGLYHHYHSKQQTWN